MVDSVRIEKQDQVLAALKYKKGTYVQVKYKRYLTDDLEKVSTCCCRLGLEYKHLKSDDIVKDTKQRISFEETVSVYNSYNTKTEKTKIRLFPTNNSKHKAKVKYYYKGEEVSLEYILNNNLVARSKVVRSSSSEPKMFTPELKNIISIGGISLA